MITGIPISEFTRLLSVAETAIKHNNQSMLDYVNTILGQIGYQVEKNDKGEVVIRQINNAEQDKP